MQAIFILGSYFFMLFILFMLLRQTALNDKSDKKIVIITNHLLMQHESDLFFTFTSYLLGTFGLPLPSTFTCLYLFFFYIFLSTSFLIQHFEGIVQSIEKLGTLSSYDTVKPANMAAIIKGSWM